MGPPTMVAFKSLLSSPSLLVSAISAALYALVFTSVLVHDQTPAVPDDTSTQLLVNKAYQDLQTITLRPHPYASHEVDQIREFLLGRAHSIASKHDYVHISDDLTSNATLFDRGTGRYFEGTNVLIKVDGTESNDSSADGVLFSGHVDSVSTSYGATDDGIAIVTMLHLAEYFSDPDHRPHRTVVFNLNFGEEHGLNGALAYYEHPWSNLTSVFVNLEGSGAGGRPLVFRATGLIPVHAFASQKVDHPRANVLADDAFAQGAIRSRTDFQVYAKGIPGSHEGMEGVDFSFYKRRAFYHTPMDSIRGMGYEEGKKSLWAMLATSKAVGESLLNGERVGQRHERTVYFDILGKKLILFPTKYLFALNIALLVVGPIIVIFFLAVTLIPRVLTAIVSLNFSEAMRATLLFIPGSSTGYGRFWVAFAISALANFGLVKVYVKFNPYVIYAHSNNVVVSYLSLSFLSFILPFVCSQASTSPSPLTQKLFTSLGLYVVAWVFLLGETVLVVGLGLSGLYWITVWNLTVWVATLLVIFEVKGSASLGHDAPGTSVSYGECQEKGAVSYSAGREEKGPIFLAENMVGGAGSTTPTWDFGKSHRLWILQLLVLIPLPALLDFQLLLLLVDSLRNTLADGSSPTIPYAGIAVFSFLITINITPFAHQISRLLPATILFVLGLALAQSLTSFPFTPEYPLKLFFFQSLDLDLGLTGSNPASGFSGEIVNAYSYLSGPREYIRGIVDQIPSVNSNPDSNVTCELTTGKRAGLYTCKWNSEEDRLPTPGLFYPPSPSSSLRKVSPAFDWLTASIVRNPPSSSTPNVHSATFSIRGVNTRVCRIEFDSPMTTFYVHGAKEGFQPGYEPPSEGIKDVFLFSRTWEREFVVDVQWNVSVTTSAGGSEKLGGRVSCEWSEYASGTAGKGVYELDGRKSPQIPALEELKGSLPVWSLPLEWQVGLVEAGGRFEI